jgi:DNA invertase Pin-like site-specific DNA recombinase
MSNKIKKVAIYIRVSTVEQSDNDFSSLDGQLNQCKAWVQQKDDRSDVKYEIINIYKDTKSGKDLTRIIHK